MEQAKKEHSPMVRIVMWISLCDEGENCLWIPKRRISDNLMATNTFAAAAASVRMHSAVVAAHE